MVLNKGCRWKVGTGQNINVWKDPWLRDETNFFVSTPVNPELNGLMVSELLIPGCQSWDYELILEYFNSRDVQEILNIPLPSTLRHDRIIWHQTNDGVYSVKSAYRIIMAEVEQHRTANNTEQWKELWKLNAPAKFKTLIWQACRNCLPTRTNLSRRGINCPLVCVICNRDMENTWHIFVSCPYAAQCWTISNMKDIVDQCAENADGFVDWFFKVLMAGDKVNVGKFAAVLWSIWKQRNNKLWRNMIEECNQVVFNELEFLYDWLAIKQKRTGGKEHNAIGRTPTEWRKPQYPFLKCNVDAAFFTDTRSMGFGMVVRDIEGKCIGCLSMVMEGLYEVKEGEAMGLREALSWIREMNFNQVIFEMDAQIIVKAITSTTVDESDFGAIIEDCRSILQQEPRFSIAFISRLANGVAHALAKKSRSYANPCYWSSPPNHIRDIVT